MLFLLLTGSVDSSPVAILLNHIQIFLSFVVDMSYYQLFAFSAHIFRRQLLIIVSDLSHVMCFFPVDFYTSH